MGRTYPLSLAVFFTVRSLTSPVKLKFDRLQTNFISITL